MGDAGRWKPYVQRQGQLLPAFVDDALEARDPVFFIDDVVDGLELGTLEQRYAVMGEHAYAPRLLRKLWLYGATQGVYSGRELARRVRRDLAFRYLAGDGPVPDFRRGRSHDDRARHPARGVDGSGGHDDDGRGPGCALMDKGYLSEANLATLRVPGQPCLIAVGAVRQARIATDASIRRARPLFAAPASLAAACRLRVRRTRNSRVPTPSQDVVLGRPSRRSPVH
jgi:Transposase domain (DUF772)